jgi:hypothetical protein
MKSVTFYQKIYEPRKINGGLIPKTSENKDQNCNLDKYIFTNFLIM